MLSIIRTGEEATLSKTRPLAMFALIVAMLVVAGGLALWTWAVRTQLLQPRADGVVGRNNVAPTVTFVHSFAGGVEGSEPNCVIVDPDGNLYGTTTIGGANGKGTFFRIAPT